MSELSSDDVVAIVGPIGDAVVAEIIGTGISKDELVAAHERGREGPEGTRSWPSTGAGALCPGRRHP